MDEGRGSVLFTPAYISLTMLVPQCQPFFDGMGKWNSNAIYIFSFRMTLKNRFCFSFSLHFEKRIWISVFVFRFRITLKNGFEFRFSFLHYLLLKNRLEFRLSFFYEFEKWINTPVIWNSPPPPQGDDRDNEGPFTS